MVLRHVWTLLAVTVVVFTSGCCRDRMCCRHKDARTCGLHKKCHGGGGGSCAAQCAPACTPVCTPVCTPACAPACVPVGGGCSMECGYTPAAGFAAATIVSPPPAVIAPAAARMPLSSSSLEPPLR